MKVFMAVKVHFIREQETVINYLIILVLIKFLKVLLANCLMVEY